MASLIARDYPAPAGKTAWNAGTKVKAKAPGRGLGVGYQGKETPLSRTKPMLGRVKKQHPKLYAKDLQAKLSRVKSGDGKAKSDALVNALVESGMDENLALKHTGNYFEQLNKDVNTASVSVEGFIEEFKLYDAFRDLLSVGRGFDDIDLDQDGFISLQDLYKTYRRRMPLLRHISLDSVREQFRQMDADEDGFVSPEDLTMWFFKLEQGAQADKREAAKVAKAARIEGEDMQKTTFMRGRGKVEDGKQPIFSSKVRAKAIFKSLDQNKDNHLDEEEFVDGITKLCSNENVTPTQALALFRSCELTKDGKISLSAFIHKFCAPKGEEAKPKRQTKLLQNFENKTRKKMLLADLRSALEHQWDRLTAESAKFLFSKIVADSGQTPRKRGFTKEDLRLYMTNLLDAEGTAAQQEKRKTADWTKKFSGLRARNVDCDKLFEWLDDNKDDIVTIEEFVRQMQVELPYERRTQTSSKKSPRGGLSSPRSPRSPRSAAPPRGDEKDKKKKKSSKKSPSHVYHMKTVSANVLNKFVSHQIFDSLWSKTPGNIFCEPRLAHWGEEEANKKGVRSSGYNQLLFLGNKTKVNCVVTPAGSAGPVIFATFRTEISSRSRFEWIHHAKLILNKDEEIVKIEDRKVRKFIDGHLDEMETETDVLNDFPDWSLYVSSQLDDELTDSDED